MRSASRFHTPSGAWKASASRRSTSTAPGRSEHAGLARRLAGAVGDTHQAGHPAARQAGEGRAADRSRALPVADQHPHPAVRPGTDQDGVRGQAAVDDPVAVRVRHRLGHLPQQRELAEGRDLARLVGQPQVEPLELLVQRVHQADAEVVVDHVPGAQQPVVGQPGHDAVLVLGDLAHLRPGRGGGPGRGDEEPDPGPVGGRDAVKGRPVLPAVAFPERFLVDDPGPGLALAPLHDPDPGHQGSDDLVPVGADGLVRGGGLQQPLGDPGQPGFALAAIQAEQVDPGGRRQQAAQSRVMQEHRLLHERHDGPGIRDGGAGLLRPADELVPELAGQPLRLAPGQLERGVLGPVPVAPPGQIVPAQGTGVVLELDQVEPAPAQDQQVHLVPLALPVPELQVRPRPERRVIRQQGPDDIEPLRLVRELRGSHLDPALDPLRHGAVSSMPARAYPGSSLPKKPILPAIPAVSVQSPQVRRRARRPGSVVETPGQHAGPRR